MIPPEGTRLILAIVEAYSRFVRSKVAERGWDVDLDDSLEHGAEWLRVELERLLDEPYQHQSRAPLELFQEAMSFPTEVLAAAQMDEVRRDEVSVNALPGDRFDLAPVSSRDLGEAVWELHIAWGAAKTESILRHRSGG